MMCVACAVVFTLARANAQTFTVDPTQTWIGYMNVFELPSNGGGYDFGSPWATADLDAYFTGPTLTLTPNDNIDRTDPIDSYWWQAPNTGTSAGNHTMAASMYVEQSGFAGGTVTFTGNVLQNTLVSPYTCVAFIDDFTPGFSLVNSATSADLAAGVFSISLNITPGDVLQYGFITTGPNARTAALAADGNAEIVAVPEPSSIALVLCGLLGLVAVARRRHA
jgi:hypothetical protein